MNNKNTLIEKLLKVAKKHKILTYPMIALIAIVSVFNYFFSWSHGAGKRIVAVVMVMIMLVSQSYFLTSSANTLVDDENAAMVQQQLQVNALVDAPDEEPLDTSGTTTETNQSSDSSSIETTTEATETTEAAQDGDTEEKTTQVDNADVPAEEKETRADTATTTVQFYYVASDGSIAPAAGEVDVISKDKLEGDTSYKYDILAACDAAKAYIEQNKTEGGCYSFTYWYTDKACQNRVSDFQDFVTDDKFEDGSSRIVLYCKRNLEYYKVSIAGNCDSADLSTFTVSSAEADGVEKIDQFNYKVKATGADNAKSANITISSVTRKGYSLTGGDVTGGGSAALDEADKTTLNVTLLGGSCDKIVKFLWTGNKYKIQFSADKDNEEIVKTMDVTYDGTETFPELAGIAKKIKGWDFAGWTIGKGGTPVAPKSLVSAVQSELYPADYPQEESEIVTLYPTYTYRGVELNKNKLELEYKKSVNELIQANYIVAGDSEDSDNSKITYDTLEGAENLEATYGIKAELSTVNGLTVTATNGPKLITGTEGVDITFWTEDSTGETGNNRMKHTVTIIVSPRVVNVTPGDVAKTYDGEVEHYFKTTLPTDVEGITVSYTNSTFDTADVGDNKKITLTGVTLNTPGEDANNYALNNYDKAKDECYITGRITKRPLYLTSAAVLGSKGYVRSGEENPTFTLDVSKNAPADSGFVKNDTIETLGEIQYITEPSRDDLTKPGVYKVAVSSVESPNYMIYLNDVDKGTFEVKQEAPNYTVSGEQVNSEWYYKQAINIFPADGCGYDTVRVSYDGSTIENEGLGSVLVSEDDYMNKGAIYVQLYDEATHAVTSWVKTDIKIDHTAPEYKGFTVTQNSETFYDSATTVESPDGLFFPSKGSMISFGSYFNNTVTVTLKYYDKTSGPQKLYYGVYGAAPDKARLPKPFVEGADGIATASFELPAAVADKIDGANGAINFCVEDAAGNESEGQLTRNNGAGEWVVDAEALEATLTVVSGEHNYVVSGSDDYYANCTANVHAVDEVSGISKIAWYVCDGETKEEIAVTEEKVPTTGLKKTDLTFTNKINSANYPNTSGNYLVYAEVTDNAQNTVKTDEIQFKVDDDAPIVEITTNYDQWVPSIKLEFNTKDELSGIRYINVTDENGKNIEHHVEIVDKEDGTSYCYFETDKKGIYNIIVSDKAGNVTTREVKLDKVSSETPDCPVVTFEPEEANESGWFSETPSAIITNITSTSDGTEVDTNYQLWKEGETSYNVTTLPKDEANVAVPMPGEGIYNLKVWTESKTGQTCKEEHIYQIKVDTVAPTIDFTTTKGSGSTILVNYTITDGGSGVDKDSIKVLHGTRPITSKIEETDTGFKGSFEISETGNYAIHAADIAGNVSDAAAFSPMSMKIKAVTNISSTGATVGANVIKGTFDIKSTSLSYRKYTDTEYKEVETVTTVDENGNVAISSALDGLESGIAYAYKVVATSEADEVLVYEGYFKTLPADGKGITIAGTAKYANGAEGSITVSLFEGKVCVMAKEVNAGDEFTFEHVADGNYNLRATDGTYQKTVRLLVKNGQIIYPDKYIELILSGKNTSVEITTDETPDVSADNMDSIFEDDNVNFTDEDKAIIEAGGTVEFKLYATLQKVSNISSSEIAAMYSVTDKNKVVGAFLDLSLYKIVTEADGTTHRNRVTKLASGANISVTIPLGDLTGKPGLEVVRIHNEGENFFGTSLMDQDNNPSTYTVTTNQFSTYAVLYSVDEPKTDSTTEITTEDTTEPDKDKDDSTEDITNPDEESNNNDNSTSSIGGLQSSGSAKTGDATPIALLGSMMFLSMGGLVLLRKKSKKMKLQ